MSTLTIELTGELDEGLSQFVKKGFSKSKAEVIRFALGLFLTERGILKSEKQIAREAMQEEIERKFSDVSGQRRTHRSSKA